MLSLGISVIYFVMETDKATIEIVVLKIRVCFQLLLTGFWVRRLCSNLLFTLVSSWMQPSCSKADNGLIQPWLPSLHLAFLPCPRGSTRAILSWKKCRPDSCAWSTGCSSCVRVWVWMRVAVALKRMQWGLFTQRLPWPRRWTFPGAEGQVNVLKVSETASCRAIVFGRNAPSVTYWNSE